MDKYREISLMEVRLLCKNVFSLCLALSFTLTACESLGPLTNGVSPIPSSSSRNQPTVIKTVPLVKGAFADDAVYQELSNRMAQTSASLLQAVLTVNSFLYTDNTLTSPETFALRQSEAKRALAILERNAQSTDVLLDEMIQGFETKSGEVKSVSTLSPDEVLTTVASGPANKQLKTLMQSYRVNAREAKDILDKAMTGLSSQYKKDADFYDTAARTATLVKEGAGLTVTVMGGVVAAGGTAGTLGVVAAGKLLITGADAAVKVSKAGVELIAGRDLKQPDGLAGGVLVTLSDASELIAFTDMFNWKDKADRIANLVNISLKANDVIQESELNLGAHTITLKKPMRDVSVLITKDMTATLPGSYKIAGEKKVVKTLPEAVTQILNKLPAADRVDQQKIAEEVRQPLPEASPTALPSAPSPNTDTSCFVGTWSWFWVRRFGSPEELRSTLVINADGTFTETISPEASKNVSPSWRSGTWSVRSSETGKLKLLDLNYESGGNRWYEVFMNEDGNCNALKSTEEGWSNDHIKKQ